MPIRLTYHAQVKAREEDVSRDEIESVIREPVETRVGDSAIEYDGRIRGRAFRVIVVKDSDPPLVITVYTIRR